MCSGHLKKALHVATNIKLLAKLKKSAQKTLHLLREAYR